MRPGEDPDEPPILSHRERMHVVREHAAGGLRQGMIGTNRDRKASHDLGHREPLQQGVHLVGGEAGGGRGQHQPQVALAEGGRPGVHLHRPGDDQYHGPASGDTPRARTSSGDTVRGAGVIRSQTRAAKVPACAVS